MNLPCIQTRSVVSQLVHQCLGYNLLDSFEEYSKPLLTREPDEVFSSTAALQAKIDSVTDHQGAVYQLLAGEYFINREIELENVRNITIYSDPNNRAILDGRDLSNFGISAKVTDGQNHTSVNVVGFEVKNTRFHGIFYGQDAINQTAPRGSFIVGNKVHDYASEVGGGIVIRNGRSGDTITVECNEIYNGSLANRDIASGEGIYLGRGEDENYFTDNVVIRGNYIHDLIAEAIDVKRHSKQILIEYNVIQRINVNSQGAIVLGLDTNREPQTYDAQIRIRRNVIYDVTSRNFNGNFIVVAVGGVEVSQNLMFNCDSHGVAVYNDCDGAAKMVQVNENIIWGFQGLPVQENTSSGNNSPDNPCSITRINNIVQSSPAENECEESSSVFAGPLNTPEGFAPAV